MNLDPTVLLATGGVAAFVTTCWSQIKTFANYISSFVVVRATLDLSLTHVVGTYLRLNYTPVPSGLLVYVGKVFQFKGQTYGTVVPFRVPSTNTLYYKGWQLLIFSSGTSESRIISLRGVIDFENLISKAIDSDMERLAKAPHTSRFHIVQVIGEEKSLAFRSTNAQGNVGDSSTSGSTLQPLRLNEQLDMNVDKSFKFDKEEYIPTIDHDPFSNLYFPPRVEEYIKQAQQWIELGPWYTERDIPWRRGWMLHGPGGTGKSSLAKAVAQKLRIPIYQYYLATLSDQEFIKEWARMDAPCVALFEDFDAVFNKRESLTEHKKLTYDCILNQISGIGNTNGVFLIVTTNHLEAIDPAMGVECNRDGISTRPGRIDTVIELGLMDVNNRYKMAAKIFKDWPTEIDSVVEQGEGMTPVQFQELLIQKAFDKLSKV